MRFNSYSDNNNNNNNNNNKNNSNIIILNKSLIPSYHLSNYAN